MVEKAFEILNKAKNAGFILLNAYETNSGAVAMKMVWPNGFEQSWSWPDSWFKPDHKLSDAVMANWEKLQSIKDPEEKIIAKMMTYLWVEKDGHHNY